MALSTNTQNGAQRPSVHEATGQAGACGLAKVVRATGEVEYHVMIPNLPPIWAWKRRAERRWILARLREYKRLMEEDA